MAKVGMVHGKVEQYAATMNKILMLVTMVATLSMLAAAMMKGNNE